MEQKINKKCRFYHPNNKCGLKQWCMLNGKKCNIEATYCQDSLRTRLAETQLELDRLKTILEEELVYSQRVVEEKWDILREKAELLEEQAKIKKYLGISSKTILERLKELTEFKNQDISKMIQLENDNKKLKKERDYLDGLVLWLSNRLFKIEGKY